MARFRVTCVGDRRKEVSRLGRSASKGAHTTIDGWNIGVDTFICHNEENGKPDEDLISLSFTGGSNNGTSLGVIYYSLVDGKPRLLLSVGIAKFIDFSDDFIDRLLQDPKQAAKLRGALFCGGKVVDDATA